MNPLGTRPWILIIVGVIAMLAGALDPLEGSPVIVVGSGLVMLGLCFKSDAALFRYWLWIFGLILFGVIAMFVVSALGGLGGARGHSIWWGILILPYPVGWIMGVVSLLFNCRKICSVKAEGG